MFCKWVDKGEHKSVIVVWPILTDRFKRWSASFDCTASWKGHDGIVLSSVITHRNGTEDNVLRLISGGNDDYIKVSLT